MRDLTARSDWQDLIIEIEDQKTLGFIDVLVAVEKAYIGDYNMIILRKAICKLMEFTKWEYKVCRDFIIQNYETLKTYRQEIDTTGLLTLI